MIAAAILRRGLLHPDRPAIIDPLGTLTYGDLRRRTLRTGAGLIELGLTRGARIGLLLGNRRQHVEALLAAAWLGMLAVPVDPGSTPDELRRTAQRLNLQALLVDPDLSGEKDLGDLGKAESRIVALDRDRGELFPDANTNILTGRVPPVEPSGVFSLSLTSGSTGVPRAIVLTNEAMMQRYMAQMVEFGLEADDRFLLSTPIHYGAGRSYVLNHLFIGATVHMRDRLNAEEILSVISSDQITTAFLVPTQLVRCLSADPDRPSPLPSLRCLIVSGDALDPATRARTLERITPNLYEVYAATEVGAISVVSPRERQELGDAVGMGHPLWNLDLQLRGKRRDGVGEIVCRGPAVSTGYLDDPPRRSRWLATGDLARYDADGRLHWVGRTGDVIVTGGRNVAPSEIEGVLARHPKVLEAAVVGLPDPVWGEAVTAFFVARVALTHSELEQHCRRLLSPHKVPKVFHQVSALPTTAGAKVDRRRLKSLDYRGDTR